MIRVVWDKPYGDPLYEPVVTERTHMTREELGYPLIWDHVAQDFKRYEPPSESTVENRRKWHEVTERI